MLVEVSFQYQKVLITPKYEVLHVQPIFFTFCNFRQAVHQPHLTLIALSVKEYSRNLRDGVLFWAVCCL